MILPAACITATVMPWRILEASVAYGSHHQVQPAPGGILCVTLMPAFVLDSARWRLSTECDFSKPQLVFTIFGTETVLCATCGG